MISLQNGVAAVKRAVQIADDDTVRNRRDICAACPELRQPLGRCGACGCVVKAKTALANQSCPLKKW